MLIKIGADYYNLSKFVRVFMKKMKEGYVIFGEYKNGELVKLLGGMRNIKEASNEIDYICSRADKYNIDKLIHYVSVEAFQDNDTATKDEVINAIHAWFG